jgi:DNA-binding transcriptional ArsR family regulator
MPADAIPELRLDQLKALTHPLRVALLKELRTNGPATATLLGRRLGESSGATSYHLRQLEKHGFVEEAPDTGDGRERWWRPAFPGHRVEAAHYLDDPEHRAVLATYEATVADVYAGVASEFLAHQDEWSRDWLEAVTMSDFRLRLTPKQLLRLVAVVEREVAKFERYDSPGAEVVSVLFQAFPRHVRPFTGDGA